MATQTIMKEKTVSTCGHDQTLHNMQMQDNLCLQTGCPGWNFTNKWPQSHQVDAMVK